MTKWMNFIAQLLGFGAQVAVPNFTPDAHSAAIAAGAIAIAQGVIAIVAHNFNPDGTPAQLAYQSK